jgi:hypothetical protein
MRLRNLTVMTFESLLTRADAEQSRTPSEFVIWIEGMLEQTKPTHPNDPELREATLLRTGIAKDFYEELYPLYQLLRQHKAAWAGAVVIPNLDRASNWDTKVEFNGSRPANIPEFLEITYVVSGKDYKSRMGCFLENGFVSLSRPIIETNRKGKKVKGDLLFTENAPTAEETTAQICGLLGERIEAKAKKSYPPNTGLLIMVEDFGTFQYSPKRFGQLEAVVVRLKPVWTKTFVTTYLVLSMGESISAITGTDAVSTVMKPTRNG